MNENKREVENNNARKEFNKSFNYHLLNISQHNCNIDNISFDKKNNEKNKDKMKNNEENKKNLEDINSEKIISLGINIGALKTVYSIFSEINGKHVSNVLLMNNSSRSIPSIMCYTKDNRLFGEKSATFLKQNLDTSYNNLSRLICYDSSLAFYKEECRYSLKKSSENYNFYFLNKENEKKEITSDKIISDYLNLINDYFFNKEKIQYDKTSISVPDFYSSNQKQELRLICEGIGMKDLTLYNESSAITMYYGYTKYRDLFLNENKKIDPTIEKNILFIDAGYSKTSLIISNFKYNEFKVEYVLCDYNLGGRNLDYSIAQFCMKNFKRLNKIEKIVLSDKMKYRLIEEIKKSRIKLTIHDDILISIDSFYNKLDLNVELTKSKFNEIKFFDRYEKFLKNCFNYIKFKKINIDCVEIAGQLMYTPILQEMVEKNGLKISKSILIDECTSTGAALLRSFFEGDFPLKTKLKNFYHYNYYDLKYEIKYDNNNIKEDIIINKGTIEDKEYIIPFENNKIPNDKPIYLKFFYIGCEKINKMNDLFVIEIETHKILEKKNDYLGFSFKINKKQHISKCSLIIGENKRNNCFKILEKGIYKNDEKKKLFMKEMDENTQELKKIEKEYNAYIDKKMELSKSVFCFKNQMDKFDDDFTTEKEELNEINRELNKDGNNLNEIEKRLNKVIERFDNKSSQQ